MSQAGEWRTLSDPRQHEDFAACLLDRGLITAEHVRQPLSTIRIIPPVPGHEMPGEIGRGGMGVVYKARHVTLGRIDAVQVLRLHLAADEASIRRFLREARASARLVHLNIVRVYDAGAIRRTYCPDMEYVDGPSLEALLGREKPLSASER